MVLLLAVELYRRLIQPPFLCAHLAFRPVRRSMRLAPVAWAHVHGRLGERRGTSGKASLVLRVVRTLQSALATRAKIDLKGLAGRARGDGSASLMARAAAAVVGSCAAGARVGVPVLQQTPKSDGDDLYNKPCSIDAARFVAEAAAAALENVVRSTTLAISTARTTARADRWLLPGGLQRVRPLRRAEGRGARPWHRRVAPGGAGSPEAVQEGLLSRLIAAAASAPDNWIASYRQRKTAASVKNEESIYCRPSASPTSSARPTARITCSRRTPTRRPVDTHCEPEQRHVQRRKLQGARRRCDVTAGARADAGRFEAMMQRSRTATSSTSMVLNSTSSCEWFNACGCCRLPPHCSTLHAAPARVWPLFAKRARAGTKWGMTTTANASRMERIKHSSGSTRASSTSSVTPSSTAASCTRPFPRPPAAAGSTITGPTRSATIRT